MSANARTLSGSLAYASQNAGLAKVCVGGESFWIRDVKPSEGDRYTGKVDNDLCCMDEHGLRVDDEVSFTPYTPPSGDL